MHKHSKTSEFSMASTTGVGSRMPRLVKFVPSHLSLMKRPACLHKKGSLTCETVSGLLATDS